jgi:hypothetical protein
MIGGWTCWSDQIQRAAVVPSHQGLVAERDIGDVDQDLVSACPGLRAIRLPARREWRRADDQSGPRQPHLADFGSAMTRVQQHSCVFAWLSTI